MNSDDYGGLRTTINQQWNKIILLAFLKDTNVLSDKYLESIRMNGIFIRLAVITESLDDRLRYDFKSRSMIFRQSYMKEGKQA